MSGSRPLAEAVTRSTGTRAVFVGSAARSASIRDLTASVNAGLRGPRFEPEDASPLYGCGEVAEGRLQKYFGSLKLCPTRREPTVLPSLTMRLPPACPGKASWAIPVTTSGNTTPVITVMIRNSTTAGRISELMSVSSSDQMRQHEAQVDQLDSDERNQNAPQAVDQQIAPQEHGSAQRPVFHPLQRERDQEHDDQRIEDDG